MLWGMAKILTECLARKMAEDLQLLAGLLSMLPAESEQWRPQGREAFSVGELRQHLVEAAGAVCACFHRLHPEQLKHFEGDRPSSVEGFRAWIEEGFRASEDADFSRSIATYFSPQGELFLSVLMSNWKHLHFHTYQLFIYLREMGIPATTADLYWLQDTPALRHDVNHG